MGLLLHTPDTNDLLGKLSGFFTPQGLTQLRNSNNQRKTRIEGWLQNGAGGQKSALALVSNALGIWPAATVRGKGRWMSFLKEFRDQDGGNQESVQHRNVRLQLYDWIYGSGTQQGSFISSIAFSTTEDNNAAQKTAAITVVNQQGRILLTTAPYNPDDLGDEDDGA
jgi:hypothetical protein